MYNKSEIFKKAWNIVKTTKNTFSNALKTAWAYAKKLARLEFVAALAEKTSYHGYKYNVCVSDWKNYGKDRTYFNVYEIRVGGSHCKKYNCGYWDNQTNKYVVWNRDYDLNSKYGLRGGLINE